MSAICDHAIMYRYVQGGCPLPCESSAGRTGPSRSRRTRGRVIPPGIIGVQSSRTGPAVRETSAQKLHEGPAVSMPMELSACMLVANPPWPPSMKFAWASSLMQFSATALAESHQGDGASLAACSIRAADARQELISCVPCKNLPKIKNH